MGTLAPKTPWIYLGLITVCLVSIVNGVACPHECTCTRSRMDCSFKKLKSVPSNIPVSIKKLDLQGNEITTIKETDFKNLRRLRSLNLMKNQIETIEKSSFQDLVNMKRLRLDRNKLRQVPDLLFANMPQLQRLDLSFNKIKRIGRRTLKGSKVLKNLQLDHNEISCISDATISNLQEMIYLTLNNNNLTSLPENLFTGMTRLKVLRLRENKFNCDCHLTWLSRWLRPRKRLAKHLTCYGPVNFRGKLFSRIQDQDLKCNDVDTSSSQCEEDSICPEECTCTGSFVDCRDRGLTEIPEVLPIDATELRIEQNKITRIRAGSFENMHRLRRIDISNNEIVVIDSEAFAGLSSLNTLVIYGNKITELPLNVFDGLSSLQLLLLNRNKISCVPVETFKDLTSLNLLSLYDNKIESLANDTFSPLINLQTLHLGRNPFICDCNLAWLSDYLEANPIETSGARCVRPKRMERKKLSGTKSSKFKCKGTEEYRTRNAGSCTIDNTCPLKCDCSGTTVDCSSRRLTSVPTNLPSYITQLNLKDNQISKLSQGAFSELPNLQILDLSDNLLEIIEDNTFGSLEKLVELNLANNRLDKVSGRMMAGLIGVHHISLTGNRLTCISNATFRDTVNLRKLDLFGNQIGCIQEGAFDRTTELSSLNLMSNPFSCNCHLKWFSKWLKSHNVLVGSLTCYFPRKMRDTPFLDVDPEEMICEENNEIGCNVGIPPCCSDQPAGDLIQRNCDPRVHCPDKCTCTGTVVRCSRKDLKNIPKGIPLDTTELYLDDNGIEEVESSSDDIVSEIGRLTQLTRLDLSNNQIMSLPPKLFANLTHLSTLIMSYNKLQCVADTTFSGLNELRILSLHGNNMSSIPYGTFDDLTSLTHLALGGNPLYCDCGLKWLSDWVKKKYVESGIAACVGPDSMVNKLMLTTPSSYFECNSEPDPEVQAKCNVCYRNPCQNRGVCTALGFRNFKCDCTPGFHGKRCEEEINACFGNPCHNNGICKIKDRKNLFGSFMCVCLPGFEGERCEVNIDDCKSHTCQNGGTCVDGVQTYTCQCTPGYTGEKCADKIEFCTEQYNFCERGKCIDLSTDYRCECPAGYADKNCSTNIDECADNICQHGSTCVDEVNSYSCLCKRGYTGKFCEISPVDIDLPIPEAGLCENHECQNNGVCYQESKSSDYTCKCVAGFIGKKCEKLASLAFMAVDSYIQLPKFNFQAFSNITIVMKTNSSSGLLMYTGVEEHLAIELYKGRVAVSFYVGKEHIPSQFSYMFSFTKVDDEKFHTIELLVSQRNFTMRVDNGYPRTVINEGAHQYLDVSDDMFLGGVPRHISTRAERKFHIRDGSSFKGCFSQVLINGKPLDFMVTKRNHKMTPGCSNPDPCKNHKCLNRGKCRANPGGEDYSCRCRAGYGGRHCELGEYPSDSSYISTCKGTVFKDIYVDPKTNCRTRRKLKYRRCEGTCHSDCCSPSRIKNRKVRLYCTDNTSYIYELPIIRKCGCKRC
ncbi:protein slit-like isoform X1 [Mercenaria mercenaria]|uniref:protein slit-like isoform X1 n=1 Tax=Mercenaria mercenaria TaxID=6596 RepID=UPI00234EA55C|nr:protein slit-like isoform X1 [Mercenaria mercenaria]